MLTSIIQFAKRNKLYCYLIKEFKSTPCPWHNSVYEASFALLSDVTKIQTSQNFRIGYVCNTSKERIFSNATWAKVTSHAWHSEGNTMININYVWIRSSINAAHYTMCVNTWTLIYYTNYRARDTECIMIYQGNYIKRLQWFVPRGVINMSDLHTNHSVS